LAWQNNEFSSILCCCRFDKSVLNRIYTLTEMSDSQKIFKRICLTTLVLVLTLNGNKIAVHGSSSGSPVQACVDMVPDHHVDAQTSASPFVTKPSVVGIFQFEFHFNY
jgi:hypothetical protein